MFTDAQSIVLYILIQNITLLKIINLLTCVIIFTSLSIQALNRAMQTLILERNWTK